MSETLRIDLLAVFAIGSVIMRGAGCIINDIFDRKFDAEVERTKNRPLASGELSILQALTLLGFLLLAGLALLLTLNSYAVTVGVASIVLIVIYPLMKRITYWPQAFLAITFNWGALVGWAAVQGKIELPALLVYAAGICWTLAYDTIYAHQDKQDDIKAGVKSLALRLGSKTKAFAAAMIALMLIFLAVAAANSGLSLIAYIGLALTGCYVGFDLWQVNLDNPVSCLKSFKRHALVGGVVFLSLLIGTL